jgi:hypothetical protein
MLDYSSRRRNRPPTSRKDLERSLAVTWERLESRQLLSANVLDHHGLGERHDDHGPSDTIEFNQTPAAVQTGLTSLASTDAVTAPVASSTIHLGNVGGV